MNAFPGVMIGHAADPVLKSGVTVLLPERPAVAAVHVSGGAPASRETDLLGAGNFVERVDAIVLSGGSAFGLAACDGAMAWLAERGRGYPVGRTVVPIVPGAALFDLANGGRKPPPGEAAAVYAALGSAACGSGAGTVAVGTVGAGTGATTADLKGGFGAAEASLPGGVRLAAYAAVNAVGQVTLGSSPCFRAAPFERDGEFGGLGLPSPLPADSAGVVFKRGADPGVSTTLAAVVTTCALTRDQAKRLAVSAHDGIALAVYPAHTPMDGDIVFALSTGALAPERPDAMSHLCAAAAATLARAIAIAVFRAEPAAGDQLPTWRQRFFPP